MAKMNYDISWEKSIKIRLAKGQNYKITKILNNIIKKYQIFIVIKKIKQNV